MSTRIEKLEARLEDINTFDDTKRHDVYKSFQAEIKSFAADLLPHNDEGNKVRQEVTDTLTEFEKAVDHADSFSKKFYSGDSFENYETKEPYTQDEFKAIVEEDNVNAEVQAEKLVELLKGAVKE
jgi:hypothetical protein